MSLQNESRGRSNGRKVRYAVVGAGWISQENFMPAVEHTGNSVLTPEALETGVPESSANFDPAAIR
jgi:predicted dehydrogenase